jgi:hypothetical protein
MSEKGMADERNGGKKARRDGERKEGRKEGGQDRTGQDRIG